MSRAKTKELNGREVADFIKNSQAASVAKLDFTPRLLILRDNDNPVINKYVNLKIRYGADIGVEVVDQILPNLDQLKSALKLHNQDPSTHGIILQLPLKNTDVDVSEIVSLITPDKDVDGLSETAKFDSATATAVHLLLNSYDISLQQKKLAIVGYGRLVGKPLAKIWQNSGLNPTIFRRHDDLSKLINFDIIVSATGSPRLITSDMLKSGATVVDSGTASENGILLGDVDDSVRDRSDLSAITPKIGGVGPLTIAVLFSHLITAATKQKSQNHD